MPRTAQRMGELQKRAVVIMAQAAKQLVGRGSQVHHMAPFVKALLPGLSPPAAWGPVGSLVRALASHRELDAKASRSDPASPAEPARSADYLSAIR